eukprot:6024557-Lingulodinium_polyedra.AAC.1
MADAETPLASLFFLPRWQACIRQALAIFDSEESDADHAWIANYAAPAVQSGLPRAARGALLDGWHASVAKNTPHKFAIELNWRDGLATGGCAPSHCLVNLDIDNIIGPHFMHVSVQK